MNTNIDQEFFAGIPGQTTETRPRLVSVAVALLLIVIVSLLFAWYFLWREETLLSHLPSSTSIYVSIASPTAPNWYDAILFWRKDNQMTDKVFSGSQAIIKNLWPNIATVDLPQINGDIELAILSDNTWVFSFGAKNKELFLKTIETLNTDQNNQHIYSIESGNRIYVSNQENFWTQLKTKPNSSLEDMQEDLDDWAVSIYIKDQVSLSFFGNSFLNSLGRVISFPFAATAKAQNNKLIWRSLAKKSKETSSPINNLINSASLPGDILVYQFSDLVGVYKSWATLAPLNKTSDLLAKLYNIDLSTAQSMLNKKQGLFITKGKPFESNWAVLIRESSPDGNQEILQFIKDLGAGLFAISHPQTREHILKDGSVMVELRAEKDGLIWQDQTWETNGASFDFAGLQGQGEQDGYFVGFVSGLGYILTTSLESLPDFLPVFSQKNLSSKSIDTCFVGNEFNQTVIFPPSFLINDSVLGSRVKFLGIGETINGVLSGCVVF